MSQSRKTSLAEAVTNVSVGYLFAIIVQYFVFPLAGLYPSLGEHLWIAGVFTVVAIVRNYFIRRLFNRL